MLKLSNFFSETHHGKLHLSLLFDWFCIEDFIAGVFFRFLFLHKLVKRSFYVDFLGQNWQRETFIFRITQIQFSSFSAQNFYNVFSLFGNSKKNFLPNFTFILGGVHVFDRSLFEMCYFYLSHHIYMIFFDIYELNVLI